METDLRVQHLEKAKKIWEILERTCGADTYWGENFFGLAVRFMENGRVLEYRFQGHLGFGGKVWLNNGQHVYVNCYQEDMDPEKRRMIDQANAELLKL